MVKKKDNNKYQKMMKSSLELSLVNVGEGWGVPKIGIGALTTLHFSLENLCWKSFKHEQKAGGPDYIVLHIQFCHWVTIWSKTTFPISL